MISQHWHGESWSAAPGVSFSPHRGHSFDLRVEVETLRHNVVWIVFNQDQQRQNLLPVEVCVTEEAASGPGEGHHWQGNRDGDIHSNLTMAILSTFLTTLGWTRSVDPCLSNLSNIYVCSELPCSCTVGCENCSSISWGNIFCTTNALLFNFWNHRGCCWWAQWLPRGYQHSKHKALVQKSPLCRPGNIGF